MTTVIPSSCTRTFWNCCGNVLWFAATMRGKGKCIVMQVWSPAQVAQECPENVHRVRGTGARLSPTSSWSCAWISWFWVADIGNSIPCACSVNDAMPIYRWNLLCGMAFLIAVPSTMCYEKTVFCLLTSCSLLRLRPSILSEHGTLHIRPRWASSSNRPAAQQGFTWLWSQHGN